MGLVGARDRDHGGLRGHIPHTDTGKAIAAIVMMVGIGFVAVLTAPAAERFMRGREAEAQRAELHERLGEISVRLAALEREE
jgi:hypothetical protein